jgi:hypothetical protein
MFPLETVLFPTSILPLHVFEPRYRELTAQCLTGDREFGVVLISRGSEVGGGDERVATGTIARIEAASALDDGRFALVCRGTRRIRVLEWLPDEPFPNAMVTELAEVRLEAGDERLAAAEASVRRARALLSELNASAAIGPAVDLGDDPTEIAWRLCALAPVTPLDDLRLLEAGDAGERLELLVELVDAVTHDVRQLLAEGPI